MISQGKPAWQSTTYYDGVAGRAVDGNRNSNWSGNSCSHTAGGDMSPWLAVDLLVPINVGYVAVVNRNDCCRKYF